MNVAFLGYLPSVPGDTGVSYMRDYSSFLTQRVKKVPGFITSITLVLVLGDMN